MKNLFNENDFQRFLKRYENTSFDSEKANLLETTLKHSLFTCGQAKSILSKTTFDSKKQELFYLFYNNLVDPQNYEEILDEISLGFSKNKIREYIQSQPVPNNNFNNFNRPNFNNFNQPNFNNFNQPNFNYFNQPIMNQQILDEAAFQKNFSKLKNESFFNTQVTVLENIIKFYFLSCSQAKSFISIISFGKDKLKAFRILYPYLQDPQNYEDILDLMTFNSEKNEARESIENLPSYYVPMQNINSNNNFNNNFNNNYN